MTADHPTIAAAERFVSIGGKLMISPRGRVYSSINRKIADAYRAGAEDSRRQFPAFDRAVGTQEHARLLHTLIRRRGSARRGWVVWETTL